MFGKFHSTIKSLVNIDQTVLIQGREKKEQTDKQTYLCVDLHTDIILLINIRNFFSSIFWTVTEINGECHIKYKEPPPKASTIVVLDKLRPPLGKPDDYYKDAIIQQLPDAEKKVRQNQRRQAATREKKKAAEKAYDE